MVPPATHQRHAQQQLQLRRRKALADALAGVIATLVSLWTFYPIDVLKTKLQAGTTTAAGAFGSNSKSGTTQQLLKDLFRGLPLKTLHAASSSFTYFYLYSSIVSWWWTSVLQQQQHGTTTTKKKTMSPAVRLLLSSIAAMLNTCLTLPLDVMASQHQASHDKEEEEETMREEESSASSEVDQKQQQEKMEQVWKQVIETTAPPLPESRRTPTLLDEATGDVFYDSCPEQCGASTLDDDDDDDDYEEESKDDNNNTDDQATELLTVVQHKERNPHYHPATNQKAIVTLSSFGQDQLVRLDSVISTGSSSGALFSSNKTRRLDKLLSLWKGLFPSLLLCSNPSINYTVFDMAKAHLLQWKKLRQSSGSNNNSNNDLTMMEAFLLGLFAKFCATMATYPLIRAKVMLMVTHRNSMLQTLIENYKHGGGLQGWYKGCSMQLLHTVLKSALLMMVKERIAVTTHRLLVPITTHNKDEDPFS